MGTPDICIPTLEALKGLSAQGLRLQAVVTAEDKPTGRTQEVISSAVKVWAEKNNIPVFQPSKIKGETAVNAVREFAPDMIIVFAYGQLIPKAIL